MTSQIQYFAILEPGADVEQPAGLVRRLQHDDGPDDEVLRQDMSWAFTPVIVEWEHGSYDYELVEVSHEQASRILRYLGKNPPPS
jgi:hypothetical protein